MFDNQACKKRLCFYRAWRRHAFQCFAKSKSGSGQHRDHTGFCPSPTIAEISCRPGPKLAEMEKRYDDQFRVVFEAIRQLMAPPEEPEPPRRRIGFQVREKKKKYRSQKIAGQKG